MGNGRRRRGRPKSPLWARLCVWIGAILVVLSGGSVAAAKVLIGRYESAVHHANLLGDARKKNAGRAVLNGAFNYLLLGSDVRAGDQNDTQGRSDTVMIFHVSADHQQAYLISLPRDLWVHIDQCSKDNPRDGGCEAKLNAAYAFGGPQLTAKTVSEVTGVQLDGMAIINFYSFDKIIDAIGGVDLCVDEDTPSIHSGLTYKKGCSHFTGPNALDYVRQREEIPDGDFGRQRHQQQLIKAAVQQIKKQNLITDPVKMDQIVRLAGNDLTIDTNGVALEDLAFSLRNIGSSDITMLRLPELDGTSDDGQAIQRLDDQGQALFAAIAGDNLDEWSLNHPDLVNHDAT